MAVNKNKAKINKYYTLLEAKRNNVDEELAVIRTRASCWP